VWVAVRVMSLESEKPRPAWSAQFEADALRAMPLIEPIRGIDAEWAWGGSQGAGVRVAIVDSGVDPDHPALGGSVVSGTLVTWDPQVEGSVRIEPEDPPADVSGHGTACGGIIHSIAPAAEIYSVRVLGSDLTAKALQFAAGVRWAIDEGMQIVNLSLSTSRAEYYGLFHELVDTAYFHNMILVSAVNNFPVPSYPSLYSSVISVAAAEGEDPYTFYYNPSPPVEFGAPGIDVRVAWLNQSFCTITGNSFAAPHIAGIAAKILGKHPGLTPFHIKTILYACAANVTHPS
jgi:subtilisin